MNYNLVSGWGSIEAQVAAATKNTTGKIFVVAASTVAGYDKLQQLFGFRGDPEGTLRFYNTIDAAINATTAARGDVILVAPGHAETLTTAGAIALDVQGASVLGLGNGDNRPVITFGSTDNTASITISGDDCAFKNIVLVGNDDALTNALNVTGNDADIDIESQDTSDAIEMATVIRLDTADNAKVKLRHNGFATGNAMVSCIRLDNCANVQIDIKGYGVLTTAWVEMVDVASTNVSVNAEVYTSGITGGTRNVVDTITGSTWDARIWDRSAAAMQRGGSGEALAFDDVGDIATAIALATADAVTNADIGDQVGNKTDTAFADTIEGSAATTQSLNRLSKTILQRIGADSVNNTAATTLVVANRDGSILERLEDLRQNESATGGLVYQGSTDAGMGASTVTVVSADLAGQTDDYFNTKYYMMVLKNTSTPGAAPENEVRLITDYVSATGTFTVTAFSVNVEASDEILVMHESLVLLGRDDGNNTIATTNVVANADGSVLERLEVIQQAVGGVDSATNILGADDADNGFASTNVVSNLDGSVLERLETIQQAVGGVDTAANVIGADNANNAFSSVNVAANGDGSILERLETIQAAAIVIDEFHDVPAADNVLNAQINEVIGNKTDAAAAGAVTATDTLVGYVKQLVTELQVVDEFHDVPLADSAANAQINEVVGNKTDTNAGNSLLARNLVPTADVATNTNMRDVVGNKADAGAAGDVSATESLMAYAKQAVTELSGGAGIAAFPTAAQAANAVNIAEVLRHTQNVSATAVFDRRADNYLSVTADFTLAAWNTAATHEILTVTGAVYIQVIPEVTGTLTDAADAATIALGTEVTTNALIAATNAAGAAGSTLSVGEVWVDATPADVVATKTQLDALSFFVGNGADVGYVIAGEALTGGSIVFHVWWTPVNATGAVVAGTGAAL